MTHTIYSKPNGRAEQLLQRLVDAVSPKPTEVIPAGDPKPRLSTKTLALAAGFQIAVAVFAGKKAVNAESKNRGLIYAGIAGSYIATASNLTEVIAKRLEAQSTLYGVKKAFSDTGLSR